MNEESLIKFLNEKIQEKKSINDSSGLLAIKEILLFLKDNDSGKKTEQIIVWDESDGGMNENSHKSAAALKFIDYLKKRQDIQKDLEILKKIKLLSKELHTQDNRSTSNPIFVDNSESGMRYNHIFSFFESDIENIERKDTYVKSNYEAEKMNKLRNLLLELSK